MRSNNLGATVLQYAVIYIDTFSPSAYVRTDPDRRPFRRRRKYVVDLYDDSSRDNERLLPAHKLVRFARSFGRKQRLALTIIVLSIDEKVASKNQEEIRTNRVSEIRSRNKY